MILTFKHPDDMRWHRLFGMELTSCAIQVADYGNASSAAIDAYLTASIAQALEDNRILDALYIDCDIAYNLIGERLSES